MPLPLLFLLFFFFLPLFLLLLPILIFFFLPPPPPLFPPLLLLLLLFFFFFFLLLLLLLFFFFLFTSNNGLTVRPHLPVELVSLQEIYRTPSDLTGQTEIMTVSGFVLVRRENETLREELRLMRIQLQSLEKVMRLQEREASKSLTGRHHLPPSQAAPNPSQKTTDCDDMPPVSPADGLLRAWRHHVLRLLMQQSAEAESAEREKADLRLELEKAASQAQTLQVQADSLCLKLRAGDAALQAANQKSGILSQQLQELQVSLSSKQQQANNCRASLEVLSSALRQLDQTVFDGTSGERRSERSRSTNTALAALLRRLQVLEHRLDFACSRLPLVRSLLTRSRHLSRQAAPAYLAVGTDSAGVQNTGTQTELDAGVYNNVDLIEDVDVLKEMVCLAQQERQQAIADRDLLASRLEEDSRTFQERVDAVKKKCVFEVAILDQKLMEAEQESKDKGIELESVRQRLNDLTLEHQRLVEESNQTRERLESQLASVQCDLAKAILAARRAERKANQQEVERKAQVTELESGYDAKFAQMKKDLQEATHQLLLRPPDLAGAAYHTPIFPSSALLNPPTNTDPTLPAQETVRDEPASHAGTDPTKTLAKGGTDQPTLPTCHIPADQLGAVQDTLARLADLAKCLTEEKDKDEDDASE
ncbi:cell differentiation [Sparganum proliferum]